MLGHEPHGKKGIEGIGDINANLVYMNTYVVLYQEYIYIYSFIYACITMNYDRLGAKLEKEN